MTLRLRAAATLALAIGAAWQQSAEAQFGPLPSFSRPQPAAPARGVSRAAYYQQSPAAAAQSQMPAGHASGPAGPATSAYYEPPQPHSVMTGDSPAAGAQPMVGAQPMMEGYTMGDGGSDYCNEGCDSWDGGCCSTCGGSGGGCGCFCPPSLNLCGGACSNGQYFFTGDYLFVRASFSEAVSYLTQDTNTQNLGRDDFKQLDFQYESSYRVGGGYRLCDCGDEIRFMFTRLSSTASDIAPEGSFVPYEAAPPPGGQTNIYADVDVKSFDVEFAKRIPFCTQRCGSCGEACGCDDPCGCGSGCGSGCGCACCPLWEVTWSGGFRFADVDWNRSYVAVDSDSQVVTDASAAMSFRGGGPRIGLEGRRYFCDGGLISVYMKGDISLLLGHLNLVSHRVVDGGSTPDIENFQTIHCRHIIPVTELETGLSGQVTKNAQLTAGYLFSAWHDLGFRDEFNFPTLMETSYDDANILGFDGFFARLEVAF